MTSTALRASTSVASPRPTETIGFPPIASDRARRVKRALDLTVTLMGAAFALPVAAIIAAAVFLESGGPILFAHERVGRGGRRFKLWKFRTMVVDGEEVLARYLFENPDAAAEWEGTRKLRNDPRVTRTGRFLRRTSLDELPQLWNIVKGDMSLAGPRPIVEKEIAHYGPAFPLYTLTHPGLTGLWQVSGRSDTTYRRRVELDVHYVRNWTAGLDLLLLLKTVRVVLRGKGAY